MSDLYRQEVLEKNASKHLGDVFLTSPPVLLIASGLVALLFAALLILAFVGRYTPTYRAAGQLLEMDGQKTVQLTAPEILAYPVSPGQKVRVFYEAYPVQSYGFHHGRVQEAVIPFNPETSVQIFITPGDWAGPMSEPPLRSGMNVSVEMPGEPVKIWRWVLGSMGGAN